MTNQIIKEPKTDQSGKAIASLVLGILSIIPILHLVSSASGGLMTAFAFVPLLELMLSILSIPGIILGVMGLKSKEKILAIEGIIFSIIGFLSIIYFSCMLWWASWEGF